MSTQKWADACTENCIWLLQVRWIPFSNEELEDGDVPEGACWNTEAVFLTRLEAFEAGARRIYNYGKYGKDWRIYGVPARGQMVEKLHSSGVNQAFIDAANKHYDSERKEWNKILKEEN